MTKPITDPALIELLSRSGFNETDFLNAQWWMDERTQFGTPILSKIVFLRECWRSIVPPGDREAIQALLLDLKASAGDGDSYYISRFGRTRSDVIDRIDQLLQGPSAEAVCYLVRSAQIRAVSAILGLLDGGQVFGDGFPADWQLVASDPEVGVAREMGQLQELFWRFDPATRLGE